MLDLLLNRDSRLEAALARYPAFSLPHPGNGTDQTPAQREENLAAFMEMKGARIAALVDVLDGLGVRLPRPGDPTLDPAAVSVTLDALTKKRLTRLRGFEAACAPDWRTCTAGADQARLLAFAIDLGIYIGECATHASEPFAWELGGTRYRAKNMPTTAGEIIIAKMSPLGRQPNRVQLDVIAWSVDAVWYIVRNRARKSFWRRNVFEFLDDLMGNRY